MKKKGIIAAVIVVLLVLATSFYFVFGDKGSKEDDKNKEKDSQEEKQDEEQPEEIDPIDKKVNETLEKMTLDEKIGQMMIVYYYSDIVDSTLKSRLNEIQPGGFILFKQNITTYDKTVKFVKDLKANVKIPMFISIDQEGGNVQRLSALQDRKACEIPYMYNLGSKNDVNLTKDVGKVIAEELRVFGVNMDFAPVIDVYSNPNNTVIGKRSFGTTPDLVSKQGLALGQGLEENGVIAVYKHFPGHGNTAVDSHVDLPVVTKTKEELLKSDLVPFKNVIDQGANVIMVGHLAVPNITNDKTPASLSKTLITDFLKNELGYNGLVVTDALNMKGLTNYYKDEEICGKAVEAGVDILLMPSSSQTCLKSVQNAVKNGTVSEEMINNSVKKILKLKYQKIEDNYNTYLPAETLNSKAHQDIINKIK